MKSKVIFIDLEKSVDFLVAVLAQPRNDYMRAAAIQAFEICFELSWKYLQAKLAEEGLEANSPRAVFRTSGQAGLIDNVEAWIEFTMQRNLTVHTYQKQLADEIYASIRESFYPAVQKIINAG
jgi:nucleotidyltransferase substrate binding protein (TIGR01987 family)